MEQFLVRVALAMMALGIGTTAGCGESGPPEDTPQDVSVEDMPQDFSLAYVHWTGSLSPPYEYSYSYEVTAEGRGRFAYDRGYGAVGDSVLFEVDRAAFSRFYDQVRRSLVSYDPPRPEDVPVGGASTRFTVRSGGEDYSVQSTANLTALIPSETNDRIQEILRSLNEPLDEPAMR